ncbi:MAG: hypothetical protein LHW64_03975 [Candidatus Cloacimonetes bacterium]|nr:hypothetical protein [Candidatus Cloacimonadota bacterium]MDY0229265.1 hypothetical protein [Candidatus Cloacimonadaceae bacterium]
MKKYLFLVLLVVFSLTCISNLVAQTSDMDERNIVEQYKEDIRIQKRQIREAAKEFLVDELPTLIALDPLEANNQLGIFGSVLSTLGEEEISYLLGHMYARIGEDNKAIPIFDSLLKTELKEDARRMLNLVLYRRITSLLEAGDRKAAREFLKYIVFANYDTGEYFSSYLYLYADMSTDDRNYDDILNLIYTYNQNRELVLNTLLPAKQQVLNRLDTLNLLSFYDNPTQTGYDTLIASINQIMADLGVINHEMISMQGMLFVDSIVQAHEYELVKFTELKSSLAAYANSSVQVREEIRPAFNYIEAVRENLAFYDRTLLNFDNLLQQNFLNMSRTDSQGGKIFAADLFLDRIYQTDRTIDIYNEMLIDIDKLLASSEFPEHTQRLNEERSLVLRERAETELLREKYIEDLQYAKEDDRMRLLEILNEYKALRANKNELTAVTNEMENYVRTELRTMVNADQQGKIRSDISTNVSDLRFTNDRNQTIASGYSQYLNHIDFISLHLSYRDLIAKFNDFLRTQASLPDDELMATRQDYRQKQLALISKFEAFLGQNPGFSAFEQPGGGDLVGSADLYYKLGELQYYAYPADLRPALTSYRRALALDPNLPERDLALYNVAFITSDLSRAEIDQNKINFLATARMADDPPANSRYSEATFRETLDALNEIVTNFPDSKIYEESVYRLGLLYFSFADDSDAPAQYHAMAIDQFNQIVAKPDSPLYYEALYQRGWVRLNSFDEAELNQAMSDFLEILIASDSGKISDPQLASDYKKDAIDNIAYCLIALDGTNFNAPARGVEAVTKVFEDYQNEDVIQQVMDKATQHKLDMGVSVQAADFLVYRIQNSPLALINPILQDSVLVLYHNSGQRLREGENLDQITQGIYQKIILDYNLESEWYKANSNKDITKQMQILDNAYEQRRIRLYNEFARQITMENLSAYQNYMQGYDAFAQKHNANYAAFNAKADSILVDNYIVLADQSRTVENFRTAINMIHSYDEKHPTNTQFYDLEQRSMIYARNVYASLIESLEDAPQGTPSPADAAYDFLKTSADRFILVSNNELHSTPERQREALNIQLLLADIQLEKEHYPQAMELYTEVLQKQELLSNTDKYETYLKLANISITQGMNSDGEQWLRKALPLATSATEKASINQDILVQIQTSFEKASSDGDFITEAKERLRLASELDPSQSSDVLGQRVAAVQAYLNAKSYQEAIDLLMEIAETDTNIDAIYARYKQAVDIAGKPDMLNNPQLAESIEQEFIDKNPASNYTFLLKLAKINNMTDTNPAAAADGYLDLFELVRSSKIAAGEVKDSALLGDAILMYAKAANVTKEYELRYRFIELYPQHENVIPYMEYMAKGHLDRNEMDKYTLLARDILKRSPDKSTYYQFVADTQLQKIAGEFDIAYLNEDWDEAFKVRDAYNAAEAGYKKEGLSFQNQKVHEVFAAVQEEYQNIQKRKAFLASYDKRLDALDRSTVFTATPDKQIRVNYATTWDRHLNAGERRIPKYEGIVTAEVNKVLALVTEANKTGYYIDNDRRMRAMDLISRLYARGAEVVGVQLESYFREATEADYYRQEYKGDALNNLIAQFTFQQTQTYLNNEVSWQYELFRQYHLAGYQNKYSQAARNALEARELLYEYRKQDYILNNDWQQELEPSGQPLSFTNKQSPQGQMLGSTTISAGNTLRVSRKVNADLAPDFAYLQVAYPLEMEVTLNGSLVNSAWVPIDSLETGKAMSTRYSFMIPGELFTEGENTLGIEFTNDSSNQIQMAANLQLLTSHQRIQANIPPVITTLRSDTGWRIINIDPETQEETTAYAAEATEWNIPWENIEDMQENAARPIWVSELEGPVENLVFETDFVLDSEFREGMINLVAPESVTVYLNGTSIGSVDFDYDVEPFMIYPGQVPIPAQNVVIGRNVLRFEVSNNSNYRGFLATIIYAKASKEGIR